MSSNSILISRSSVVASALSLIGRFFVPAGAHSTLPRRSTRRPAPFNSFHGFGAVVRALWRTPHLLAAPAVLLLVPTVSAAAQTLTDLRVEYERGMAGIATDWNGALRVFRELTRSAQRLRSTELERRARYGSALALERGGLIEEAMSEIREAIALVGTRDGLAASELMQIGASLAARTGRGEQAVALATQAVAVLPSTAPFGVQVAAQLSLSNVYVVLGQGDRAERILRRLIASQRRRSDGAIEGSVHLSLGRLLSDRGESGLAVASFRSSLNSFRRHGDRRSEGVALNLIASELRLVGQYTSALAYFDSAYSVRAALQDYGGVANTLNGAGGLLLAQRDLDGAKSMLVKALEIHSQLGDSVRMSGDLNDLGYAYLWEGQLGLARASASRALAIRERMNRPILRAKSLTLLGHIGRALDSVDLAGRYYGEAIRLTEEVADSAGLWLARISFARLLYSERHFTAALAQIDSSEDFTVRAQASAGDIAARTFRSDADISIHHLRAVASLALADSIGEESAILISLAAIERGRSLTLLRLMATGRGDGSPRSELSAEGRSRARICEQLQAECRLYAVLPETTIVWTIAPQQPIRVRRVPISVDTLGALVRRLRSSFGIRSAYEGASRAGIPMKELEGIPGTLGRDGLTPVSIDTGSPCDSACAHETSRRLAEVLLVDVGVGSTPIIVVPDGPLNVLPFAALPLADRRPQLLAQVRPVLYTPSLAVLSDLQARLVAFTPASSGRGLVVGDPAMPFVPQLSGQLRRLAALPGAMAEAVAAAKQLGTTPLIGRDATETAVKARLLSSRVVHLATHGVAFTEPQRTRESFLALAVDGANDGMLSVQEILSLKAVRRGPALVTLSACETGIGNINASEGTLGFQWALLAQGASRVLVSLWAVDDDATRTLFTSFYTNWNGTGGLLSAADALRSAQEVVRAVPRWRSPRYWSAFQLVGLP
jgi:tetratricopeptide (TPR) repeat protein